jgi:5'-phosphate synthase pdxT subunit
MQGPVKRAGVVGLQGDVSEHIEALGRAFAEMGMTGEATWVRRPGDLERVDALVIPGGESTTISKLLVRFDLHEHIRRRALEGMPVLGTCAGMIVMCQQGDGQVERTGTRLLGLMDAEVDRNAFGRQRESFEADLAVEGLEGPPLHAVFIRAPAIRRTWGSCTSLASLEGWTVMARQGDLVAASFHPELTPDTRVHRMLLDML